ncbi:class I SAM-dependent methyltransferase [Arenicella sp. 4NH20-0111]|uniref:class I SAM-dependent methyltransferase n=1 Tax=Arenicella sp. 4NH20-0111 TaxID=3127648 RepID=UPI0031034ADE
MKPDTQKEISSDSKEGFDPKYFSNLFDKESKNFWFKARNEIIQYCMLDANPEMKEYLEVGCGTGFVLSGIEQTYSSANLTATEYYKEGLEYASHRVPSAKFRQMDGRDMPFINKFDMIGMFDVLEHIEEDEAVLAQAYSALQAGGHIVLTVPQHQWLWSHSDDYAYHRRRYATKELDQKLIDAGFRIHRSSSFVTFLMPLLIVSRVISKLKPRESYDPSSELQIPETLNHILYRVLQFEKWLIKKGMNLPFGGSRVVVAKK